MIQPVWTFFFWSKLTFLLANVQLLSCLYLSTLFSRGNSLLAWIKGTAVHLEKLLFFFSWQHKEPICQQWAEYSVLRLAVVLVTVQGVEFL